MDRIESVRECAEVTLSGISDQLVTLSFSDKALLLGARLVAGSEEAIAAFQSEAPTTVKAPDCCEFVLL